MLSSSLSPSKLFNFQKKTTIYKWPRKFSWIHTVTATDEGGSATTTFPGASLPNEVTLQGELGTPGKVRWAMSVGLLQHTDWSATILTLTFPEATESEGVGRALRWGGGGSVSKMKVVCQRCWRDFILLGRESYIICAECRRVLISEISHKWPPTGTESEKRQQYTSERTKNI